MSTYRLSTDYADLGKTVLNIRDGSLYEVDPEGRKILSLPNHIDPPIQNDEIYRFMVDEGILVCPEENKNHDKFHLQWHLLNNCNLRCTHCYDWKNKLQPLSFEQMIRVVDDYVIFLKKMEMDGEISLTGGEPMLFVRLPELIEYIKSRDVFISTYILTNGTIPFSKKHLELFKKYKIGIQISLDGLKETNDQVRGKGVFEKCIRNIKKLLANNINTSIHYVIMKKNIDDIKQFILEMENLQIKKIHFSTLVPIGPGAEEQMVSPTESRQIMEWIMDFQKTVKVNIIGQRPLWTLVGSKGFCPVGYKTLTIYADGTVFPCRRLPISIGDIRIDSFFKIWFTSDLLIKMRQREKFIKICGKCSKASECGGCRAIAYAIHGDAFAPDPSCWLLDQKII